MTTNDPTQPMVPRLPESPDEKEPPGTHKPEQPIDDPPAEGPPGALARAASQLVGPSDRGEQIVPAIAA